jgi:hypothetical protein
MSSIGFAATATRRRRLVAAFVLDAALEADIHIAISGETLHFGRPRPMTYDVWNGFRGALTAYREEIIALLQRAAP